MQSERIKQLAKDPIQITAECRSHVNPYWLAEDKYSVITNLYIVNSGTIPIQFSPEALLSTEQDKVEFRFARGAREYSQKKELSKNKAIVLGAGEDYLIELFFKIKDPSQYEKIVFNISGININENNRSIESFVCRTPEAGQ